MSLLADGPMSEGRPSSTSTSGGRAWSPVDRTPEWANATPPLALPVGAATGRRSAAFAAVAVVAILGFFGNNLGPTIEGLGWLRDISPFRYYSGGQPLRNGLQPADLLVLAIVSLLLVGAGGWRFNRRDLAV